MQKDRRMRGRVADGLSSFTFNWNQLPEPDQSLFNIEVRLYYKAGERYAQMNDFGLILSGRNILYKQERAYIAYALFFLIYNALLMSL